MLSPSDEAGPTRAHVRGGVCVGILATLGLFLLHPRLGIRDVDGYAYLIGARSLREGLGYRSLTGEPFNHWPPGYSLLLSVFPDEMAGALMVNYLSFGVAVGLLYHLLRRSGWSWQAGLGLSVVLASGFFRQLANMAHADVTAYALFFVAIGLALHRPGRTWPGVVWGLLIPVKFVAVTFLPSAVAADAIAGGRPARELFRRYRPVVVVSVLGLTGVLVFNMLTAAEVVPASHLESTLWMPVTGARIFVHSIPREFLFNWHGSALAPLPKAAFVLSMALAMVCLVSLRPIPDAAGRWLRAYGAAFLVCIVALLFYRRFGPTARITGYGLIVLLLGFRPKPWANGPWLLYAGVAVLVAITNGLTTPSLGLNDPRYVDLTREIRAYYQGSAVVATNSFRLLDLHAGIPSVPIASEVEAGPYQKLLWVTMPNVDVTTAVMPMARPGPAWCEERRFSGAVLFTRCEAGGGHARMP